MSLSVPATHDSGERLSVPMELQNQFVPLLVSDDVDIWYPAVKLAQSAESAMQRIDMPDSLPTPI